MPEVIARRGKASPPADKLPASLSINAAVTIVGSVEFDGPVEIDGFVQGDIRCASLTISRYGTVSGTIIAGNVTIAGGVSGTIYAEHLVLKPECDVEGEICYRELALEAGSYFEGKSRPHQRPLEVAASRGEARQPLKV